MNGRAQRNREVHHAGGDASLLRRTHGHRDGRSRRLGTDCGEVCREHGLEHLDGVAARYRTSHRVLQSQGDPVQNDHHDEHQTEDRENLCHLTGEGHIRKHTHDVHGQQGNNHVAEHLLNDDLEVLEEVQHRTGLQGGNAQAQDEGENQCTQHAHNRGQLEGDVTLGESVLGVIEGGELLALQDDGVEQQSAGQCQETSKDAGDVRQAHGDAEHLTRTLREGTDTGHDEADNNQRNREAQEGAEHGREGDKELHNEVGGDGRAGGVIDAANHSGGQHADEHTRCNRDDNPREEGEFFEYLHGFLNEGSLCVERGRCPHSPVNPAGEFWVELCL